MAARKNLLSKAAIFPVFSIHCPVFFLPLGVSGNFSATKQVCGLWGVPLLICVPAQIRLQRFYWIVVQLFFCFCHSWAWGQWVTHLNRDAWDFLLCICVHAQSCTHVDGRMLLAFLGLHFVTVMPPNEEVEGVSVFYYSQLQTPYQMPGSLSTSHKHFILIPAHKANLSSFNLTAIRVRSSLQP